MNEDPTDVELLDVPQAARRLGARQRFVRRLVAERRIRFYKIGAHVRFHPDDLADYIHRARVEPVRPVLHYEKGTVTYG